MQLEKRLIQKFEQNEINKREKVIEAIKNRRWSDNIQEFYNGLLSTEKYPEMLTPYSMEELSKFKIFKVENFNIGFALKENENSIEIVSLHNFEPEVENIGRFLMEAAIKEAHHVAKDKEIIIDHYDGFLSSFYESLGFVEYKRDKFDPQYDPDGEFEKKYGKSDIIYRKFIENN